MMVEHRFVGDPTLRCELCNCKRALHRYDRPGAIKRHRPSGITIRPRDRIIGIDGEGKGRKPHRYTYLSAVDEQNKQWQTRNVGGISTIQAFDFLLSLPDRCLCFGFAFLYDLTKICQDMPDADLYELFHEQTRVKLVDGRQVYRKVRWGGYTLNYVQRRFSIERGSRRTVVWDIFAFFQAKFTTALKSWAVADEKRLERMERMKALRSEFDKQSDNEVEAYCNEECSYLATLGRKLIAAHEAAGLNLKAFHGAGSTASAFLARINVRKYRGEIPVAMRIGVASAFYGGRFENSRIGPVRQRTFNYDISSAYPYRAVRLPCLSCGRWRHSSGLPATRGRLTLVHWKRDRRPWGEDDGRAWGTLPVRLPKGWNRLSEGTIAFPIAAKGGWTWGDEFDAARRIDRYLEPIESWTYDTDCDHQPFASVPEVYRERIKLGKDAQGIVLKLGMNSIYGKLAQSVGLNPPFQSWVWAGNITSGCRAQLLDAIASAKNPWAVLMLATDGVWTTERLTLSKPLDTGTSDLPKPLGGWEEKCFERGVFCVRPGIYFPLEPTENELESVRARGLGRRVVYEQWRKIVDGWEHGASEVRLGGVQRFVGAKTGFSIAQGEIKRRPQYGEWILQDIKCSFNARPKRDRRAGQSLLPWRWIDVHSIPYENAVTDDGALMALAQLIAEEQPNVDYADIS